MLKLLVAGHNDESISFIERIQQNFNDPTLKVDIVSHNIGALVTCYYLRYGKQDVLDSDEFTVTGQSAPYTDSRVRYIVFGGACHLTPARCLVEQVCE